MIDRGAPGHAGYFIKCLKKLSIEPEDIKLMVITQCI